MGLGVLVGYATVILLLILSPIIFFIFRKNGKTKIGLLISGIIVFFCIYFLFTNTIGLITNISENVLASEKQRKLGTTKENLLESLLKR